MYSSIGKGAERMAPLGKVWSDGTVRSDVWLYWERWGVMYGSTRKGVERCMAPLGKVWSGV